MRQRIARDPTLQLGTLLTAQLDHVSAPTGHDHSIRRRPLGPFNNRGPNFRTRVLAREAIAFVEQSDFLPAHAEALMDLAEILRLASRPEEAAPVLKQALLLHRLKGNVVSATRVSALLDELH